MEAIQSRGTEETPGATLSSRGSRAPPFMQIEEFEMRHAVLVVAVAVLSALSPAASFGQTLLPVPGKHEARASGAIHPDLPPASASLPPVVNASKLMVVAPSSSGLTIVPTFDSSITSDPQSAAIENAVNQAIAVLQAKFSDPITVQIYFRYATTEADTTTPLGAHSLAQSNYVIYTVPWATYLTALTADATTSNDSTALASLPSSALTTSIIVSSANGRAVNLSTRPAMSSTAKIGSGAGFPYDGIVTVNSGATWQFTRPTAGTAYDAERSIEHEIDEILGLGSYIGQLSNYRPQDLFSFSAPGTRSVATTGTRYFSIDSGVTNLVGFNQDSGGDYGDWLSDSCPQALPYVQNAFSCRGQSTDVDTNSPEGINLDVIGYNLNSSSPASSSCAPSATTLCLSSNRFAISTTWRTSDGNSGNGTAVALSGDTGYFWFFNSSNVEMVLKVLNGCGLNSNYWVFAGGLTNVSVTMTVIDTKTGVVRTYTNPQGAAFQPIQDTGAFSTCP